MKKYLLSIFALLISIVSLFFSLQKVNFLGARTDNNGWNLVAGNGYFAGRIAIGTTTVNGVISGYSTGTTTLELLTSATTSIACLKTKNNTGAGVGYTSFMNGTPSSTNAAACGY